MDSFRVKLTQLLHRDQSIINQSFKLINQSTIYQKHQTNRHSFMKFKQILLPSVLRVSRRAAAITAKQGGRPAILQQDRAGPTLDRDRAQTGPCSGIRRRLRGLIKVFNPRQESGSGEERRTVSWRTHREETDHNIRSTSVSRALRVQNPADGKDQSLTSAD